MEKNSLYKYFHTQTTKEEDESMLQWVESSDENLQTFINERNFWNASMLSAETKQSDVAANHKKSSNIQTYIWKMAAMAAMLVAVIVTTFFLLNTQSISHDGMQTVYVPVGQRSNIILPDGTSVWLNSNTTFSYPSDFNTNKREVFMNGEAYFEVAKDEDLPFIVITNKSKIEVLGTTFNVYDYKDFDSYDTSVKEGSVKVLTGNNLEQEFLLEPNQKVSLKNHAFVKLQEDSGNISNWTTGVLVFEDEPIEEVFDMLSAYYNRTISLEFSKTTDYRCTAKFLYNDGLDYILRIIQKDLHYTIENDKNNDKIFIKQ